MTINEFWNFKAMILIYAKTKQFYLTSLDLLLINKKKELSGTQMVITLRVTTISSTKLSMHCSLTPVPTLSSHFTECLSVTVI